MSTQTSRGDVFEAALSPDGRTMYVANLGTDTGGVNTVGLRVLDVSEVQDRVEDPQVRVVSDLTWPQVSIPQVAEPFTRDGHQYLLEVDEFENFDGSGTVGAARIIDIDDVPGVEALVAHQVRRAEEATVQAVGPSVVAAADDAAQGAARVAA